MASQDLTALFAHEPDRAAADAPAPAGITVRPIAADTAGLHPSLQGDRPRPKKSPLPFENNRFVRENAKYGEDETYVQGNLFEEGIFTPEAKDRYLIIGQVFDTYWIVQCDDHMLMVDQHAAHEKVLYERFVKQIKEGGAYSQQLMPPRVVSLSAAEEEILLENMSSFTELGFEIEHFGGRDYALRAVPENLTGVDHDTVFSQMLASLLNSEGQRGRSEAVKDRIATMACKAAVKGNNSLTRDEFLTLLDEMMKLDNPYNCPHGRPTMIRMSKYEIEKRFKRII
jgi:DNA mismatch repair protein MutL